MRGVSPPGSFLSGGLDSSSITCLAGAEPGRTSPLPTFSAVFDDVPECDERPYINAVLAGGRYDAQFVRADMIGPLTDWERTLASQDEPFSAPNLFIHAALYQTARRHGTGVILDGFDGDTTVSHGMAYLTELANRFRWLRLFREIHGLSRRFDRPLPGMLWRHGVQRFQPARAVAGWLRDTGSPAPVSSPLLNPDFADRLRLVERHQLLQSAWLQPPRTEGADHFRRLTWGIIPAVLEALDKAAAVEGVEPRYPFFDKRLVEFCLALPPTQKIQSGWTRLILRRAMGGILPPEIQWRGGKSDPGPSFVRGLVRYHRELLDEVVLGDPGTLDQYVNVACLRRAYRNLLAGETSDEAVTVWRGAVLSLWLRAQ
jgi:asparagine synthase (glutamine-hydrolysing)